MLKMKREAVDELAGRRKAPVAAPTAAPAPDASQELREAIATMSHQVAKFAEAAHKPKKLEAIVHRGSDGKMERVTITVL